MNNSHLKAKITNPLDQLFDTLPADLDQADNYSILSEEQLSEIVPTAQAEMPEKDEEDLEIDSKIDTVYTAAMSAFANQTAYMDVIEPRYAARNAEVAANYLNIALNAAATRARVKGDRRKTAQFVPFSNNRKDGAVVASREDILRLIAVDAETKKV
jgi:hypothetical protein